MSEKLNPEDFIIKRKRKKYKFALFHNFENCFEFNEWTKRKIDVLEIGAGNGLFSVELAKNNPEKTFVALDVKADRLQAGAKKAIELGLKNIFFVRARADLTPELFDKNSIEKIWITFADPFPKKGSSGRRMTSKYFLEKYKQILSANGEILLKHDDLDFFHFSLENFVREKFSIEELSFDLHESDLPVEYKIKTAYEEKWLEAGKKINFVRVKLPKTN